MIEPGELHRYFMVREIATGREVWILGGDTRYEVTGPGLGDYRASPEGEYFLAQSAVYTHPWGRPMRLEEVEPLPDGQGIYADPDELKLAMTYEGSWRQYADQLAAEGHAPAPNTDGGWDKCAHCGLLIWYQRHVGTRPVNAWVTMSGWKTRCEAGTEVA